jgi:malate dehydrogenase (oxaloacetate-decarboxylating)
MFPVIYTPTEGEAIAHYSGLFRKPEGCFLNIDDQDQAFTDLKRWGEPDDIDLIVVSDGEQVILRSVLPRCLTSCRSWVLAIKELGAS